MADIPQTLPYLIERNGEIVEANDALCKLAGYSREEIVQQPLLPVWKELFRVHPEPASLSANSRECFLFTQSHEVRRVHLRRKSFGKDAYQYTFLEKSFEWRQKFPFVEHLFYNGITGVAIYSADMILLRANQIYLNFLDDPYREARNSIGRSVYEIVSGFEGSMVEENWLRVLETGSVFDIKEMPYTGYERGLTYWNTTLVPVYEEGTIKYLVQTGDEITESVRQKERIKEQAKMIELQRKELEIIIRNMSDAVYVIDREGKVQLLNEVAKQRFQQKPMNELEDYLKETQYFNMDGTEIPKEDLPVARALRGEKVEHRILHVRQTSRDFYSNVSAIPLYEENSEVDRVIICSHDITEMVLNERELRKHQANLAGMVEERTRELTAANEKIHNILDSITDGFFVLDKEWRFTYINKYLYLTDNKKREDVLGKNIWEAFPRNDLTSEFYKQYHIAMTERIPVFFETNSLYDDIFYELRVYPFDDGICVFIKNITERKTYEKELQRLSRLDLIGQMAAGISHEIRNPMTTVRGFLQLLGRKETLADYHETFSVMIDELDRANAIVSEFLSMGSNKLTERKPEDLNAIVANIAPLIQADALRLNKYVTVEPGDDVPEVMLDNSEIRQLLLNLCRNGLEAMEEGTFLTIRTYATNDHVVLEVEDQGAGIPPEVMEKIGTPFFTTKDNGTGLGLGVCYGIAARHQARIVFSTGKTGTKVFVKFKRM